MHYSLPAKTLGKQLGQKSKIKYQQGLIMPFLAK